MSATNRGAVRKENDFYETPEEVTRDFLLNHFEGNFHTILEPCAGSGKMIMPLRERFPEAEITAMDQHAMGWYKQLAPTGADSGVSGVDFRDMRGASFDLIFTNPPYSIATEIIEHALKTWPKATVVMLLRLNFLGSQQRHQWWKGNLPTEIHVLSKRPSFTGKGTDATEYAWFVWRPGVKEQKINVIWGRMAE